jgi:hypothetical protein
LKKAFIEVKWKAKNWRMRSELKELQGDRVCLFRFYKLRKTYCLILSL